MNKSQSKEDSIYPIAVSIIVPIYNVEKYLRQCLDSIITQTLKEIEIICINDGSSDTSLSIMKEYAVLDNRIKIIDKPNKGYGHTLNTGIEMANGDYIGIVESDDFIEPNMFAMLYNAAKLHKADIVKSNFFLYWGVPYSKDVFYECFKESECDHVITPRTYGDGSLFLLKSSIWSAIYKREMIKENNIQFLETPGASFQDTSFTFKVFSLAERMVFIHNAFLHYRQDNENSSVNSSGKVYCICDEFNEIERFISQNPVLEDDITFIKNKAFYDTCIWNYERLSDEFRYEFLLHIQPWFQRIIDEKGLDYRYFHNEPWKWRDLFRIARDPMEYHTWRYVERYEQSGGNLDFSERNVSGKRLLPDSPFFSIVVPVYNVEKYLYSCLESLTHQTYSNIEIICVNDGSSDRSLKILKQYQRRDNRVVVIDRPNGKSAAARNTGSAAARGKYIIYIDSDDWIAINTCERIKEEIDKRNSQVDIVVFGSSPFPDNPPPTEWLKKVLITNDSYYEYIDEEILFTLPCIRVFVWHNCFNRSLITENNFTFDEECVVGEDALFLFEIFSKAHGISIISDKLHNYRHFREGSIMNKIALDSGKWAEEQLLVVKKIISTGKKIGVKKNEMFLEFCLDFVYFVIVSCAEPQKSEYVVRLLDLLNKNGLSDNISGCSENCRRFFDELVHIRSNYYEKRKLKPRIKGLLKRILPPSRESYHMRMDDLVVRVSQLERLISELLKKYNEDNLWLIHRQLSELDQRISLEVAQRQDIQAISDIGIGANRKQENVSSV